MRTTGLKRTVRLGMLGGLAFILAYFEVRLPFFPAFLKYDTGDVPALIATFSLGPVAGLAVQFIKAVLFWASGRSADGLIGVTANFVAGSVLVMTAGLVQKGLHRSGRLAWGWSFLSAASGAVMMAAVLIPVNALVMYPLFGWKGAVAWNAALVMSTPFNLFKGFVSSILSLALHRRLMPFIAPEVVRLKPQTEGACQ